LAGLLDELHKEDEFDVDDALPDNLITQKGASPSRSRSIDGFYPFSSSVVQRWSCAA
jgi:hypothetical protein